MADEETAVEKAARYRGIAETLRTYADQVRFNYRQRSQLLALAAGFDRAAERVADPRGKP